MSKTALSAGSICSKLNRNSIEISPASSLELSAIASNLSETSTVLELHQFISAVHINNKYSFKITINRLEL